MRKKGEGCIRQNIIYCHVTWKNITHFFHKFSKRIADCLTWNIKFHLLFDIAADIFATYSTLVALKLKTNSFLKSTFTVAILSPLWKYGTNKIKSMYNLSFNPTSEWWSEWAAFALWFTWTFFCLLTELCLLFCKFRIFRRGCYWVYWSKKGRRYIKTRW